MIRELGLVAIGAIALTLTLVGASEEAEAAAYLKFEGIEGESTDKGHEKWIDVLSFSHTMYTPQTSTTSGTSSQRGNVVIEDITVTKELDKSTPKISEKLLAGEVIPKLELELTSSSGTYLRYELNKVMITSYSISGSGQSGDLPTESITLNFEKIKVSYTEFDSSGSSKGKVEYGWDLMAGKKV